jgi:hypothetical protein
LASERGKLEDLPAKTSNVRATFVFFFPFSSFKTFDFKVLEIFGKNSLMQRML